MKSLHFDMLGSSRTYWDLFVAAGFTVGVLYLFAAVLAWQLGSVPAATLSSMRVVAWGFVLCFAGVTVLSFKYLFIIPVIFSFVITACLTAAAWLASSSPATHGLPRKPSITETDFSGSSGTEAPPSHHIIRVRAR